MDPSVHNEQSREGIEVVTKDMKQGARNKELKACCLPTFFRRSQDCLKHFRTSEGVFGSPVEKEVGSTYFLNIRCIFGLITIAFLKSHLAI